MNTKDNKCIKGEIAFENKLKEKMKKDEHKRKIHKKKVNSNLNLKLSIFNFLGMCILALFIILNKGEFGEYSLVKGKSNAIHNAELECGTYKLSILDDESTSVTLTVDGAIREYGFTLKSSDESIAKIVDNTVVAGEKSGVATISAYLEEEKMTISTEVFSYIPINTIIAKISSATIKEGTEATLKLNIEPDDGTTDFITYTSSDKDVATVSKDGVVIGVSSGTATITIKDELTGASTTKDVTVK